MQHAPPKLFKNKTNYQPTSLSVCATTLHSSSNMRSYGMSQSICPLVQATPPQNIHCSEPQVWLKTSDAPSSWDPPWNYSRTFCWCSNSSRSCGILALWHLRDHSMQPRSRASMWPFMAPWATDIADPNCSRTMDPDLVSCNSPGLDITMTRWCQWRPLRSAWPPQQSGPWTPT